MTPPAAVPGSRSERSSAAESISSSEDCWLRSGNSAKPVSCSCRRPASAAAGGSVTSSIPATSARTRVTAAARSAAVAPGAACSATAIPSAFSPNSSCSDSLTACDWLPGTSKPPPVKCSVCLAANGSAASTITTQIPTTHRRRRPSTAASRFIASRMIRARASPTDRSPVCARRHFVTSVTRTRRFAIARTTRRSAGNGRWPSRLRGRRCCRARDRRASAARSRRRARRGRRRRPRRGSAV